MGCSFVSVNCQLNRINLFILFWHLQLFLIGQVMLPNLIREVMLDLHYFSLFHQQQLESWNSTGQ